MLSLGTFYIKKKTLAESKLRKVRSDGEVVIKHLFVGSEGGAYCTESLPVCLASL